MATFTQAAGAYTATYKGSDIGIFEGALRQNKTSHAQDVLAARFADTVMDAVYRGGNVFQIIVVKEWTAAVRALLWPWDAELGVTGVHGRMASDVAGVLVLTAIVGTPARTQGPVTRSYPLAFLSPEHNVDITFGAEERNIPIVMRCLPTVATLSTGNARHFTDT